MTDILLERVKALKLYGIVAHWDEVKDTDWIEHLVTWEEREKIQRSLERRLMAAQFNRFKSLSEFDWSWPKTSNKEVVAECMELQFIQDVRNIILCGPNGVGKSTIASNIAHHSILQGHTALFVMAGQILNDLASQDGDSALRRRIKYYTRPTVLVIDEVGYLSYSNRHADLMFEIISRRYQEKPTIITTNKPFAEWGEIFPNASCVVSLIDRLVHQSEIINIDADSYRLKEAKEENAKRKRERKKKGKNN